MEVVVDASAAVRAVSGGADTDFVLRARLGGGECHAPHLIDAEVGSVLRRQVANGDLAEGAAATALVALEVLITARYSHTTLARAAWALRHNVTYYDALYVALAARLGVPLLTADARLAAAPGLPCAVEALNPPSAPA